MCNSYHPLPWSFELEHVQSVKFQSAFSSPFFLSFVLSSEYGQTSTSWRLLTSGCGRAGSAECITQTCQQCSGW